MPEWVLRRGFSWRALRLYAELGLMADYQTGDCEPSHAYLAGIMGCSKDTVQRAQAELEKGHAIHVERRLTPSGDQAPNLFTVFTVDPIGDAISAIRGSRKSAAGWPQESAEGGRTDAAQTRTTNETSEQQLIDACEQCDKNGLFIPDVDDRHAPARKCDHRIGALAGGQPIEGAP